MLLRQAVNDLKSGKAVDLEQLEKPQTDVDLRIPALLPEEYMPNVNMRLSFYKRLASMTDEDDIIALKIELIDRFGKLPPAMVHLLLVGELKVIASDKGVDSIVADRDRLKLRRSGDYISLGGKFPRLTKKKAAARLREVKKLLLAL